MVSIEKIKGAKIIDIIKITLENILLELYFNIQYLNEKFSFKLGVSDEGETILFNLMETMVGIHLIK